jgi:hypothetical protein
MNVLQDPELERLFAEFHAKIDGQISARRAFYGSRPDLPADDEVKAFTRDAEADRRDSALHAGGYLRRHGTPSTGVRRTVPEARCHRYLRQYAAASSRVSGRLRIPYQSRQ